MLLHRRRRLRPPCRLRGARWLSRLRPLRQGGEDGATTAEFAIVTMAAVGFAGVLVVILKSEGVRAVLQGLIERALGAGG